MKDKIPFYDIINKFFVGAVFFLLFIVIINDKISLKDIYNNYSYVIKDLGVISSTVLFIAMYEIGLIINRCSSIIIAPMLEKTKIWSKDGYKIDVSEIKKENETFNSMITELVLIRSHILMYVVLAILALICKKWIYCILFLTLTVLFVLSGKKHNDRINIIRKEYKEKKETEATNNETN